MSLRKKTFTLIEMLIVVVIIGILAAALIPRLQGVQGRARDVQRKTNLSQIGQGMSVLKSDENDSYSGGISGYTLIEAKLVPTYLASLPKDPSGTRQFSGDFGGNPTTAGAYGAATYVNGSILALGAWTEIKGSSNGAASIWGTITSMSGAQAKVAGPGSLLDGAAGLRYYYLQ